MAYGTFSWRNCSVKILVHEHWTVNTIEKSNKYKCSLALMEHFLSEMFHSMLLLNENLCLGLDDDLLLKMGPKFKYWELRLHLPGIIVTGNLPSEFFKAIVLWQVLVPKVAIDGDDIRFEMPFCWKDLTIHDNLAIVFGKFFAKCCKKSKQTKIRAGEC